MAWWSDEWPIVVMLACLLLAGGVAGVLRRRARRRHARRWAQWRRDHARRLPWELFRRRGGTLRLTDERVPPRPGA